MIYFAILFLEIYLLNLFKGIGMAIGEKLAASICVPLVLQSPGQSHPPPWIPTPLSGLIVPTPVTIYLSPFVLQSPGQPPSVSLRPNNPHSSVSKSDIQYTLTNLLHPSIFIRGDPLRGEFTKYTG